MRDAEPNVRSVLVPRRRNNSRQPLRCSIFSSFSFVTMSGRFFNLRAFLKQCVFVFSGLLCGLRGRCEFSFLSCVLIVMHAGVAVQRVVATLVFLRNRR